MKDDLFLTRSQQFQRKIGKLQEQFKRVCLAYGASASYSLMFLSSDESSQASKEEEYRTKTYKLADEINQLKKGQSFHQRVSNLLQQRDEIIRSLREELISNKRKKQPSLLTCCEQLAHLRMYNLNIIEQLQALKQRLNITDAKYTSEICGKLLRDTDFLRLSPLRKHIEFSNQDDPLFLIPLKKFWNLELNSNSHRKPVIELFSLDESYKSRLVKADQAIKMAVSLTNRKSRQDKHVRSLSNRKEEENEIIEKKGEEDNTRRMESQTLSNFYLPKIPQHSRQPRLQTHSKEKKQKGDESSIYHIIEDYQHREKLKKAYDQYQNNGLKIKKRAVTQANQYSIQKVSSSVDDSLYSKPRLQLKSHYLDDDHNDEPESTYLNSFKSKPLAVISPHYNRDRQSSRSSSNLEGGNSTLIQTSPKAPNLNDIEVEGFKFSNSLVGNTKTERNITQNVIAGSKPKMNKLRKKEIKYTVDQDKCKQTVYNNFASERMSSNSQSSNKYQQNEESSVNLMKQQSHQQPRSLRDSQKDKDQRYKNPFDILKEIRYKKKEYQVKLVEYDEKNLNLLEDQQPKSIQQSLQSQRRNGQYENRESSKTEEKSSNTEMFKDRLKAASNRAPILQFSSLNINQAIKVRQPIKIQSTINYIYVPPLPQASNKQSPNQKIPSQQTQKKFKISRANFSQPAVKVQERHKPRRQLSLQNQYKIQSLISKETNQITVEQGNQISIQSNYYSSQKPSSSALQQQPSENKMITPYLNHPFSAQPEKGTHSLRNQPQTSSRQNQNHLTPQQLYQININPNSTKPKSQAYQSLNKDTSSNQLSKQQSRISLVNNPSFSIQKESNSFPIKKTSPKKNIFSLDENEHQYSKNNISFDEQSRIQNYSSKPTFSAEQTAVLKKCIFQSKAIEENELISTLKSTRSRNAAKVIEYTHKGNYFTNRHITFSTCSYNNQTICICLTSPYMTLEERYLFIIHLEIVQETFKKISPQLIYTFIKYLFCHDPSNKIIYLRMKQLFNEQYVQYFADVKNYSGEIKTPIKSQNFDDRSYLFERKAIKCNKTQDYTTIFNSIALFIRGNSDTSELIPLKGKDLYFSSTYLKRIQSSFQQRQVKKFATANKLETYLQSQHLPHFKQSDLAYNISLYEMVLEECLTKVRFYSYAKYFYFTIQNPYTYFYESQDVYYLLIATSFKNKYFMIADRIYQESDHIDLYKHFREKVMNKRITELFVNEKTKGKIVACPQFKKKAQIKFSQTCSGLVVFQLNWKDYIKGGRYFRQQQIHVEFIGPFLCGLVELSQDNSIKHIYSTIVQKSDLQR